MTNGSNRPPQPRRKPLRLPHGSYQDPAGWYFVTICCSRKRGLLGTVARRDLVQDILCQTATGHQVELAAYTILPDHLHFIGSAGRHGLMAFVRAFKSRAAVELRRRGMNSPLWQRSFFDHKLRSQESLRQKCRYVWMNPLRRGLVGRPEDYRWSGSLSSV